MLGRRRPRNRDEDLAKAVELDRYVSGGDRKTLVQPVLIVLSATCGSTGSGRWQRLGTPVTGHCCVGCLS